MFRLFRILYTPLYTVSIFLYTLLLPYFILFKNKRRLHLLERAGRLPSCLENLPDGTRFRVWIQAASVGEVSLVKPIIGALSALDTEIFLSTATETGQVLARQVFGEQARIFFFPLDWKWVCSRYLKAMSPDLILLAESEFWPAFTEAATQHRVPVVLINGRISDRSFPKYFRLRQFFGPILSQFDRLCMQSRQDKQRAIELGVPEDRVNNIGNLKYDYQLARDPSRERLVEDLKGLLGAGDNLIWLCGSTREREEGLLLPVFQTLRVDSPELRWIIAPRHPQRSEEVEKLLRAAGLAVLRRSRLDQEGATEPTFPYDAVVIDTIGELPYLFALADIVFIGGSLVPWGGHNVIEPAYFGKPILFGPYMQNFREIAETFLENYAALQVSDPRELSSRMQDLLRDARARNWLGRNARKVIRDNQGATERTIEIIRLYLERRESRPSGFGLER